jgi:two-component system, cell cycle sensor histidine kinase and response regulator CckA
MSRKLTILALWLIALHVGEVLILGTSAAGSLVANSLQMIACAIGTAAAFAASRRGYGLSRPFWMLIGAGLAMWGVANLGWMYYDNWLHSVVPSTSVIRVLFVTQGVFFAIALFLDKERDSASFDLETFLDSLQTGMVFFSAFFGLYYLQILSNASGPSIDVFMTWTFEITNVVLTLLAAVQAAGGRTQRLRSLYGGLTLFLLINTISSGVAEYMQSVRSYPTGTWADIGWSVPFLACAIWASRWEEPAEADRPAQALQRKTRGALVVKNLTLALAPMIVLVVAAQLEPQWRGFGLALLGVSITCYAAQLGLSQYREGRNAADVRRHTLAMDSAMDGMAIVSPQGKYDYVNAAFARMMGHAGPEAMIGKPWSEAHNPEDIAPVVDSIRKALALEGRWFGDVTIRQQGGRELPLEVAITKLPDGGVVTIGRDITDRRSAEQFRAEAEAKYQTLVEQVAAVSYIAELGVDGQWLYVSPQVEAMFGFGADDWLANSRKWIQHIHPDDHVVVEAAEEASKRGERFQAEYRVIRKDGRVIWVSDTAVVVPGSNSHPLMEGVIVDITERKQLEGQLQQARRMEAVGRLAGGIAHDFNNLLTIIKGYTELGLTRARNYPELRGDIERIEGAAERAAGLVRQLLAFSRRQVLQPKVIDLNGIVLGLDQLLRRLMDEDIAMKTVVGQELGMIKADPGQIEQVIMNLVMNARDAMPDGGRLIVETENVELDAAYARDHATVRPGRYVMLAVSDTGVGMSGETIAHIFEPFYTTKESGRGTGLGLSTVYGIVKQSGGYIWVYSEPGKGTTFKVYLPRVNEPAENLAASDKGRLAAARAVTRTGTETILLVEDEPHVRELTRTALAGRGYSVIEALNAEEAERLAEKHGANIHLLLTDVIMPGISGRELAKRISARQPAMRVLYMSGYTYNVIAEGGTLERGVAFLQKPFTPSALIEKVREVLDAVVPAR